ncbi:MAG: PAS domain S-box protein [Rhodospirillaceae bacterium]|nr:PAS domain S-box protein [Rhodospirillales bacterium]
MQRIISTLKARLLTLAVVAMVPVALLSAFAAWGLNKHVERLHQDEVLLLAHTAKLRLQQGYLNDRPLSAEALGLPPGIRLWLVDATGHTVGDGAMPALTATAHTNDDVLASVPMDPPGSRMVVAMPPELQLSPLGSTLGETFAALAVAMGLALGIAWMGITRLVLTKVELLNHAAERIRAGEMRVRSGLTDESSEFGRLARTFDDMAAALDQRAKDFQHSLRESEDRFQQMARVAPTGIFCLDAQLRMTYANPWCAELTGRSEHDLIGSGWYQAIHPDDLPWMEKAFKAAQDRGMAVDLPEYRLLRPDGSVVWVLMRDALERDSSGAVTGRIGTMVDVSSLKRTTEALRNSEERFRKLARIAPVGIFRADVDGDCTYANDALATITRRPKHELNGQNWRCFLHAEDRARVEADGEPGLRELRLLRPDGREAWVLVREVVERDGRGNVVGRIGTMFDITGQMMARQALRTSEERFQVALKHSPVAVFAQDLDLRYTWMFNGPPGTDAIVGLTDEDLFPPDEAQHMSAIKRDVLASCCGRREEISCGISGVPRQVDVWFEPLLDEHGKVTGLVGAAVDITQARQLQAELTQAREEAERANKAKSRFLAAASHDLRQPFQAMRLFRAALTPFLRAPKAEIIAAKLDEAMSAGEQLLGALLDVSTLEAGIVAPKPIPISAADLVARLAREFNPQTHAHGLSLKVHAWHAIVLTDPVMLERILRNLLHNAVRYTETGGILIGARRRGDRLVFQVWDTGIGIEPEQQEKVFEDFYQIGNPGRDRSRGLGLGLSVVARTAQLLNHPVTLHSCHGRGTVFSVSVPLANPPAA